MAARHTRVPLRAVTHGQETLSQHMGTRLTCFPLGSAAFLCNLHRKEKKTLRLEARGPGCDGISRTDHTLQIHSHSAKGAFCQVPSGRLPSSARSKADMSELHQEQKGSKRWRHCKCHCGRKTQGAWVPDLSRRLSDGFQPPPPPPPSLSLLLPRPYHSHGDVYRTDPLAALRMVRDV